MAKLVFFTAVIAALVATSVAADRVAAPASTQCQCQRELQEISLGSCPQFVDMQLDMTEPDFTWLTEERKMWCCQELQQISSGCRAAAIRSLVRKYEQDLEAARQPQIGGPCYPAPDEPVKQQPETEGPRYPVPGETAEKQPRQEGGQLHHGCPAQRMQTVVRRQQPVGGLLPVGLPEEIALERLTRARQLVAQLPAQCRLECGAFSPGQY